MESPRAAFGPSHYETCCLVIAFLANLTRPGVFVRALVGPLLLLHGVCDAKLYSIICYICICVYIYMAYHGTISYTNCGPRTQLVHVMCCLPYRSG